MYFDELKVAFRGPGPPNGTTQYAAPYVGSCNDVAEVAAIEEYKSMYIVYDTWSAQPWQPSPDMRRHVRQQQPQSSGHRVDATYGTMRQHVRQ